MTNEYINSIPFILHIFKNNFNNEVGSPVYTIIIYTRQGTKCVLRSVPFGQLCNGQYHNHYDMIISVKMEIRIKIITQWLMMVMIPTSIPTQIFISVIMIITILTAATIDTMMIAMIMVINGDQTNNYDNAILMIDKTLMLIKTIIMMI